MYFSIFFIGQAGVLNFVAKNLNIHFGNAVGGLEILVPDYLTGSFDLQSHKLDLDKRGVSVRIIETGLNQPFGVTLNSLFKMAKGNYCISFHSNLTLVGFSSDEIVSIINRHPQALSFYIGFSNRHVSPLFNRLWFDSQSRLAAYANTFDKDKIVIWKRTAYFLVGGFDDRLHLSADADFHLRLLERFPDRARTIQISAKNLDIPNYNSFLLSNSANSSLLQVACDNTSVPPPKVYKNTFFFCFTHATPLYQLPNFVNIISVSGVANFTCDYRAADLLPDFLTWEELLLGELGIFVAQGLLQSIKLDDPDAYFVAFCYYRKFFSISELGPQLNNGDPIFTVLPEKVDYRAVADEVAGRLVAPTVMEYEDKTVLEVYAESHCLEDYLFATQLAVDIGVIPSAELDGFLAERRFIHWAHAGCTLPLPLFMELADKLRRLYGAIIATGYRSPIRHIPYQRRWVAYYFERLSSYLLLKHYPSWQVPKGKLHNVNLPSEGLGVFNPGGLNN